MYFAKWLITFLVTASLCVVCRTACTIDQFECGNTCIRKHLVCNGVVDCWDRSDETICDHGVCSHPALFKCESSSGTCISVWKVCDGSRDCSDNSDEKECGSGRCNHPALYKCDSGLCIAKKFTCDGTPHCPDNSDEKNCGTGILALTGVNTTRTRAVSWLKSKRNGRWGWDENTHRAIIVLYLSGGASFDGKKQEEDLMAKQLELKVALALLRNETIPVSANQMALYINAILVTCHNPRDFYGFDLVHILKQMIQSKENSTHPVVYLALCNANETVPSSTVRYLLTILDYESEYLFWTDIQAMAVMALSCITNQGEYAHLVSNTTATTTHFKQQQRTDGSFGNVYTSALVVQALLATGNEMEKDWDLEGAIKYLQSKQTENTQYSFGDFLSTYLTLPILMRRSFADIANVNCTSMRRHTRDTNSVLRLKNHLGPFVYVMYTLYVGDDTKVVHPISLKVPSNITVQDVMNLAGESDPKYKYESKRTRNGLYVYTIAGISNDPETGMYWLMYLGQINGTESTRQTESPDKIRVKGGEHIIMWYKTADIQT